MKDPSDYEIDCIFRYINDLHLKGQFQVTDAILKNLDIKKIHPTLLLSYLTISRLARHELKEYDNFFHKVEKYFVEIGKTDPRLLSGLE